MENYSLSDVAAVTGHNGYGNGFFGGEGGFFWIFALLILPMLWGGNGFFGGNRGEAVTEAGLCNAMNFNNLENAVGRLSDTQQSQFTQLTNGICNLGYEQLRNISTLSSQLAECCCSTKQLIQQGMYENAMNTAAINANTTAQVQSIKDMLCAQEAARKDARIWQLEMNQAMAGVVRYPTTFSYNAGTSPFCGGYNCGCGCNNI